MAQNPAVDSINTAPLLMALREDARFQAVMMDLWNSQRPPVPAFEPKASTEQNTDLIERIKFANGMQKGFDLLFGLLVGRLP